MSAFKDLIQKEIGTVFLNTEEFGQIHQIDGKGMKAMIDDMENVEREKKTNQHMDGVYIKQVLLYVAAEDFGKLPKHGRLLNLDGKDYRVADAIDEDGIYSITLEAHRS